MPGAERMPVEDGYGEPIQKVDISSETLERSARAKLKNALRQKLGYNVQGKLSSTERLGQHLSAKV